MMIGDVKIDGRLVLAPMARVTSLPFRLLCKGYGCNLLCSEMVNANALARENMATLRKIKTCREEKPLSIQVFGTKKDVLLKAAQMLDCDIVDINLGCPDHDVMRQGAGAALLKRPSKIGEIIGYLSSNLNKPVTAKIRIGPDKGHVNGIMIAKIIEKAGASAITIHGRTVAQKYSGKSDWEEIRKIKEAVSIPIIANGDINDEISARECLDKTGADLIMVGRAAIGEPYIFKRVSHFLETGKMLPKQKIEEKIKDFFRYVDLARKYDLIRYAEVKTNAQWSLKSMKGGSIYRKRITESKDIDTILVIMKEIYGVCCNDN